LIIDRAKEQELLNILIEDRTADLHHPTVECFLGAQEANDLRSENKKLYKLHRSAYKNTGFCIAYGGSNQKVSVVLGKPLEEIEFGATTYRERFPRISKFASALIRQVSEDHYVKTAFGRKLHVPLDKKHTAANYLIQGTAAGILKRAQVRVDAYLQKHFKNEIRLLLPIHDELLFSFPLELNDCQSEIVQEISNIMTDMPEITVPLEVEWKETSTDWNSAVDLII